jgi:peptide deformylase
MILMDDIIKDPADVLRAEAEEVVLPASDEIRALADEMMEYIINSQDEELSEKYGLRPGVGLAAPQVGKSLKMTAIAIPMMDTKTPEEIEALEAEGKANEPSYFFKGVVVNPVIVSEGAQRAAIEMGEGCLSIPEDIPGFVPRSAKITVEYFDLDGNKYSLKLRDYPAIVFQHEIDHLHGKLYYDYINPLDPWKQDDGTRYIQ